MKKSFHVLSGVILASLCSQGATVVSTIEDLVLVSYDQTDRNDTGTTVISDSSTLTSASQILARERASDGQANRQIQTYLIFNLSGLTPDMVNGAGFQSTLTLDYIEQLNSLTAAANAMSVRAAVVGAGNSWSDTVGDYPLATWLAPADSNGSGLETLGFEVLADVPGTDPSAATDEIVLDMTSIVQDWVNGTTPNNGLVIYGTPDANQGAGFTFTSLVSVPEPSTALLLGFAAFATTSRRRRSL